DGSAFARVRYTDHYVIEVVDRVTGETRTLDRPDQDDVALSFSPDSRRLLFVNWPRSNQPSLWALEVSSGEALPVSDADHLAADGAWTPDGEHVAYFANGAIWMRAMDETVSRLLLVPASADWLSGLSVSADGKHVAYFGPADDD